MSDNSPLAVLHPALLKVAQRLRGPILAFDTSATKGSLALVIPAREQLIVKSLERELQVAECLTEALAAALDEGEVAVRELQALVVGVGPGSFTGLRVALATAKGLAYPHGLKVYGLSSLELLASSYAYEWLQAKPAITTYVLILPVVEARLGEVFTAAYGLTPEAELASALTRGLTCLGRDTVVKREDFASYLAHIWQTLVVPESIEKIAIVLVGDREPISQLVSNLEAKKPEFSAGKSLFRRGKGEFTFTQAPEIALQAAVGILRVPFTTPVDLKTFLPNYLRVSEAERQLAARSALI